MTESELGLLQMKRELVVADTVKLCQPVLGVAPERFDAVDMIGASHEFVVSMVDPKVLLQANVHQSVIATPAIGMNDAVGIDLAADDGLQRGFGGIGDDFGVHAVIALEQTKDDGLASGASAACHEPAWGQSRTHRLRVHRQRASAQRSAGPDAGGCAGRSHWCCALTVRTVGPHRWRSSPGQTNARAGGTWLR